MFIRSKFIIKDGVLSLNPSAVVLLHQNLRRLIICVYFSPDSEKTTFSMDKAILWIDDSYFSWK